ncbi:UPF0349 protein [Halolactibacillus alkaliphilus]|uniref:UPF0349 protein n=1 Tax=Halolactibacillus alkaliphilus TaxID=442899 RepID=A0A511X3W0_9BACI|nr:DUF1450 domain-containing protein [Halolactibacillus alkaliphilus]GEN57595.1 UPF0349 protein [Halolactibacillus alkaliphilus]GGN74148.1 UPF0349 protein [Halolactibacillus alkaliphilus]SFP00765.1 Uncharacterized protein YuzB, UPF0349 family [Halolactibacillus alkaliphilus]
MGTIGIIIVEICESNLLSTIETEGLLEEEYPEVSVITSSCLSYCGLCRLRPFAMVNGRRIKGKDVTDALNNIRQAIDEALDFYR